ncbi:MAG TPA: NAD(P)/FAD-dependent oxidoreductase, partial [Myxococcota bacterium]|nr:NAD(P)/FAD-dependent oxidoreductase [Myxococcota bacterium]
MQELDAVIVGAGFAGLCTLLRLRELGFSARVFERGGGVGGTWYWNRYPGARCDVESMEYSYQFSDELQQEWCWSERYAAQPEILRYLEHVTDRFDLRRDISFDTAVRAAVFDEAASRWEIETSGGDKVRARFCIFATGCLSSPVTPRFPGLESFTGETFHTGRWPHEPVDFRGKRVGVIGTGSSAVQSIPLIAEQAAQLFVFQRTPTYTIPAHNHPLDPAERDRIKADYAGLRKRAAQMPFGLDTRATERLALSSSEEERRAEYEERWSQGGLPFLSGFADLLTHREANDTAAEFVRAKIRELVRDPQLAKRLSPEQVLGCKRLCIDSGYYETFNRANVTLVDLRDAPIEAITPRGVRTRDAEY